MSTKGWVALCAGIVLVVGYITMSIVIRVEEVEVPKIEGLFPTQAQSALESKRLIFKERDRRFHEKIPEGYIIEQDPLAGESLKRGRPVWAIISKGSMTVAIPDLHDQSLRQAGLKLQANGLMTGHVARVIHAEPVDVVLAQTPEAHAVIPRGSSVSVLLSAGPELLAYVMPDFLGMSGSKAKQWLASAGVVKKKLVLETREDVTDGIVLSQQPVSGAMVKPDDMVELTINAKSIQTRIVSRMVPVLYDVPRGIGSTRRVRMIVTDDQGQREIFNELKETGTQVKISVRITGEANIEVFLDHDTEPVEVIQQ